MKCSDCHGDYIMHPLIESEVWEEVAADAYALCAPCLNARLQARGMTAVCDIAFCLPALRSRVIQPVWRYPEVVAQERAGHRALFNNVHKPA